VQRHTPLRAVPADSDVRRFHLKAAIPQPKLIVEEAAFLQQVTDPSAARRAWAGLTPDLLEKARGRVTTLAWVMFALIGAGALIDLLYAHLYVGASDPLMIAGSILGWALSGGLILAARDERLSHITVLRLALVYEVIICLFLAVFTPWLAYMEIGDVPYVTWVTPLIILFPLIVPSPPRVTLITAVAAAATRPLGLALLAAFAGLELPAMRYVVSTMSPAFAVVLAYVGSRVVHGMSVDLAEARRLGSYVLESRLGEGGMGEVWQAKHRLLVRPAAVKLIRPELVARDPARQGTMLARFEREAQVTAAMSSPHTIQVYDFGIERSGTFYYVMELLRGLDLEELVRRFGPVPAARTAHLLTQVCDSLGEAHEHGLIHRDVKPANIYVCRYGRQVDFVKVLDFGLVKLHHHGEQGESPELELTIDHSVGGTPAFIAPEQVAGEQVDGRTDIYSLGCVAYWLLTGSYVFEGNSALQTMVMHVREAPPAPSSRTEQPVPDALDRIVLACLEKDPAGRPQSVDELAALLEACDVGDPWTPARAANWWSAHLSEL
jgi:serine/threonine-protein kinase